MSGSIWKRAARSVAIWLSANWAEAKTETSVTAVAASASLALTPATANATENQVPRQMPALTDSAPALVAVPTAAVADAAVESHAANESSPASDEVAVEVAASTGEAGQAGAAANDFRLAARLAAVSKLNAPSARAGRRPQVAGPARRAIPLATTPETKVVKDKRLPLASSPRPVARKAKRSAEIVDLASVRTEIRTRIEKRAA